MTRKNQFTAISRFVRRWLAALDGCRGQPRPPAGGVSQVLGPRAAGKVSGQSLCGWSGRWLQLRLAVRGASLLRSCLERCCAVTFSFAALVCSKLRWISGLQAGARLLRLHERVCKVRVVGWPYRGESFTQRPVTHMQLTAFARALCAWQVLLRHPEPCTELLDFFACGAARILRRTISRDLEISRA